MRRRITDLFKKIRNGVKNIVKKIRNGVKNIVKKIRTKYEAVEKKEFQPERKKPPSKWVLSHNEIQAKNANALRKRRAKNKVASKSRRINAKFHNQK